MGDALRFAYADPPYLGCGARLYGDATYDDIFSHQKLIIKLSIDFPDGWAMSLNSTTLRDILPMCPKDARIAAWVKPFASFKPNVNPGYAWEPVIFTGGRKRDRKAPTVRDWHSENITLRKGLAGAKPKGFALWVTRLLGVDFKQGDIITDIFPGTGGMTKAWAEEAAVQISAPEPLLLEL